jgi:hypothetical protein
MKDMKPDDPPAEDPDLQPSEAQPWHAADEKRASTKRVGGAPIGTHSLTGGGANVGMPTSPRADAGAERSTPRDMPPGAEEPDPLAEPRANVGEIPGRKP